VHAVRAAQSMLALLEPELPRAGVKRDRALLSRIIDGLDEMPRPSLLPAQLNARHQKTPSDDTELAQAVKALRKHWAGQDHGDLAMSSKAGSFNPAIYRLVADMAELRGHLDHWSIEQVPDDAPPRGLRRTYTKARRIAHEPVATDSFAALVGVLDELTVQVSVINKACPVMVKAQRKLLSRGTDALTAVLQSEQLDAALRAELGKNASKAMPGPTPLAERVADVMRSNVQPALAESPAAFMNRLKAYWSAWRDEAPAK